MNSKRFKDLQSRVRIMKLKKNLKIFLILTLVFAITYYVISNNKQNEVLKKELHIKKKTEQKKQIYKPVKREIKAKER